MWIQPDAHPTQFWKWRRGLRQPAISRKRKSERNKTEWMWEPDRSQGSKGVREAKGPGEQRGSGEPRGHGNVSNHPGGSKNF